MVLSDNDPKLLNFLYELTKLARPMSYKEIAGSITLESGKVSPKTVERWFNFLKQPYNHPRSKTKDKFDYFPKFYYEKLGLVTVYVMSSKPSLNILAHRPISKYQNYAAWLYDFELKEPVLSVSYLVPAEKVNDFKKSWESLKKNKIVSDYDLYLIRSATMIYSPWHKTFNSDSENHKKDIDFQLKKFDAFIDNIPETKMVKEIKKNPLIVPVLFEYLWECKSSYALWGAIKERFGPDVWKFIRKAKTHSDGVGIKKVQKALKEIKETGLSYEMKMIYMPIHLDNIFIYSFLEFKDKNQMMKTIKEMSLSSLQLNIYPMEKNKLFVVSLLNGRGFTKFINIIEKIKVKRVFALQHEKSLPLLTSAKYTRFKYSELFDPVKVKWKN